MRLTTMVYRDRTVWKATSRCGWQWLKELCTPIAAGVSDTEGLAEDVPCSRFACQLITGSNNHTIGEYDDRGNVETDKR